MEKLRPFCIGVGALLGLVLWAPGPADARDKPKLAVKVANSDPMAVCLQSWDAATHMSKREWKVACRRTVREFPLVYTLPPE